MAQKKVKINTSLCDSCEGKFLCAYDCVTSNFEIVSDSGKPYVKLKERGYCINCGHCISICHKHAISNSSECVIDNGFLKFISMKRTVRHYARGKNISNKELDLLIQAADTAPSEKNRKTVRVCFIKDHLEEVFFEVLHVLKKEIEKLGERHPQYSYITNLYNNPDPIFWGAEYVVVIVGREKYAVDAAIVAERIQLMAFSQGIDSGYNNNIVVGINGSEIVQDMLGFSNYEKALVCFTLGYSDLKYYKPYIGTDRDVKFY